MLENKEIFEDLKNNTEGVTFLMDSQQAVIGKILDYSEDFVKVLSPMKAGEETYEGEVFISIKNIISFFKNKTPNKIKQVKFTK